MAAAERGQFIDYRGCNLVMGFQAISQNAGMGRLDLRHRDGVGTRRRGRPRYAISGNPDVGLRLAAPFYQGGFGNAQLPPNAGKALALDSEAEEVVASGWGVHFLGSNQ
jgi:hypothetical protein